jgi:hypothetical protein
MARQVTALLLDPAKAQRLGAAGRRHVIEHWSIDRMVHGYEELIEGFYQRKTGRQLTVRDKSAVPSGPQLGS